MNIRMNEMVCQDMEIDVDDNSNIALTLVQFFSDMPRKPEVNEYRVFLSSQEEGTIIHDVFSIDPKLDTKQIFNLAFATNAYSFILIGFHHDSVMPTNEESASLVDIRAISRFMNIPIADFIIISNKDVNEYYSFNDRKLMLN